jgi:TPR repeat protein
MMLIATCLLAAGAVIAGRVTAGVEALQQAPENIAELRSLAEAGDAAGQCRLGTYYSEGPKEARDLAQARLWFQRAADQGFAEGQRRLGRLLDWGDPSTHDAAQAAHWYALAARQGDAVAPGNLKLLPPPRRGARSLGWHGPAEAGGGPDRTPGAQPGKGVRSLQGVKRAIPARGRLGVSAKETSWEGCVRRR